MNKCVSFSAVKIKKSIQLIVDLTSGRDHHKSEEKAKIRRIQKKPIKPKNSHLQLGFFKMGFIGLFWVCFLLAVFFNANPRLNYKHLKFNKVL